jgi:tetratricopeptide (TPR) repeat protein
LGQFYERAGKYAEAADAYTKALAATPTSRDLKLRLASVLLSATGRENAAKAVEILSSLVQQNAKDVRALYLRSQAYRRAGNLAAAESDARAAMTADRTSVSGAYALAQVLAQQHRHADVIALLEPIVAAPGRGAEIVTLLEYLSFAYQSVGNHQKAIDALVRAQTLAPDEQTVDLYLIQAYIGAKKYSDAVTLAAEAQKKHPSQPRFVRLQARALFKTGSASRALALLEAGVKATPDDSGAYLALADLYAEAGRVDEAVKLLDRAAERFPKDATLPYQQGSILEKADRSGDAERAFQRALQIEPDNADALNYLGYMLAERGQRLDDAVRFVTRALELDPDNPSYLDSLGWAQFKRGELTPAEQNLTRAAAALPRNSVIQDHLGDLFARLGRTKEAASAWSRALEGDSDELNRANVEKKIRDIQKRR